MAGHSNPLAARLLAARSTVEEAASSALRSAEIEETVIGGGSRKGVGSASRTGTGGENEDPNIDRDEDDDAYDDGNGRSSSAAFELGMTLFGDDVSAIERDINERLVKVEVELRELAREAAGQGVGGAAAGAGAATRVEARGAEDDGQAENDGEDLPTLDPAALDAEARALAAKASFLRKCSSARAALDEEERLSLSISGAGAEGGEGTLVESSRLLSRAESAVGEAEDGLAAAEEFAAGASSTAAAAAAAADLDAARRIAASIRSQVRRRRSELRHRASSAFDRFVSVTADGIAVGPGAGAANAAVGAGGAGTATTAGLGKAKGGACDTLPDAYDAVVLLSSKKDDRACDDVVHLLYQNLYELILEPILEGHTGAFAGGTEPPRYTLSESESSSRGAKVGSGRGGTTHRLELTRKIAPGAGSKSKASSSSSAGMDAIAAWSHVLDVISAVLKFVRRRILMERPGMCHALGRYLFGGGDYKSSPSAGASDGEGGALLYSVPSIESLSTEDSASPLFDKMVRAMWDTCLPSSMSLDVLTDIPEMGRAICVRTGAFDRDLIEMGLRSVDGSRASFLNNIDDDDDDAKSQTVSPLSDFATNFERRYGEKRRTMILSDGRDVLLGADYHNTVTVGVEVHEKLAEPSDSPLHFDEADDGMSIFALHKCSVSEVASKLMSLCRRTMDDAVDPRCHASSASNTLLPPQLYRTARELLDLYRAVIPAAHGREIASVPRTAAVLHNDCVFFAHHCLTLGVEYRDRFPAPPAGNPRLRQHCTFVDLVPPFRELAERTMGDMIERQKLQLLDIVGSRISVLGDALRSNESVIEWTDAETALTAGDHHTRHLSQAWRPILSRDVYNRAMGTLVDAVFALFLDQVMNAHDISEPASHFIGALFQNATRTMSDLFAEVGTPTMTMSATASADSSVAAKRARMSCGLWDKFCAVGEFMFMSLADITAGLAGGKFRSVTGPELSKLIVAAFDDSDKRRVLLRALSSDGN